MANKHMKRCPMALVIREMQIKTMIRYYHIPIRMAKLKSLIVSVMWNRWNSRTLLVGEYKMVQTLWKKG